MSLETIRKWIGTYMMFGSLTGIYALGDLYPAITQRPSILWVGAIFGTLFVLIGAIGISLLKDRRYIVLAMLLQGLQLVGFSLGYKYVFCAGTSIKIGYHAPELLFMIEPINSEFSLGKNIKDEFFYVNIIPLIIILLLNQLLLSRQKTTQIDTWQPKL